MKWKDYTIDLLVKKQENEKGAWQRSRIKI